MTADDRAGWTWIGAVARAREEAPFLVGAVTFAVFQFHGDRWLVGLTGFFIAGLIFMWLFAAAVWATFGVVRHADALAHLLGEPFGTLILTLSVIGIEVSLIASVMLTGIASPELARDTMFAVLMIVLNGLVGAALLLGGLRHKVQDYNLQGARAFLVVLLPLSVFALILPDFTVSTADATFSPLQAGFFALITILLYGVFLIMQTVRHRTFFEQPTVGDPVAESTHAPDEAHGPIRSRSYHTAMLLLTLVPIVLLSKRLAKLVDFGIVEVGAPVALGGVLIALLVLLPESMSAIAAARANLLQRSVNLLLGSALATIGLTVPAILAISLVIGHPVTLGLDNVSIVLLVLTLVISTMTFGGARTNVLQGAVHLVLFLAYLLLIFSP